MTRVRSQARHLAALLSALWVTVLPAVALACPQCAGRAGGSISRSIAVGTFVMMPFAVSWAVFRFVKKGEASLHQAK